MTTIYHANVEQGSDEWISMRRGLITASEMHLLLTPTLKVANNDKSRAHVYELAAQRISRYVEPHYISDDMLRGREEEIRARILYSKHYASISQIGFVTRTFDWGTLGYSPDGLVGDDGLTEFKSRRQKFQVQTIIDGVMPDDYMLQVQTGLLVTGRKWLDFGSYCGGLPMKVIRVFPDEAVQAAIIEAAKKAEADIVAKVAAYAAASKGLVPTERLVEQEMVV